MSMRRKNRLGTVIFAVFFLGFLGVFVSQVYKFAFGGSGGLPDPVRTTATVILRERSDATKMERVSGTSTPRTYSLYTLTGEYTDGELTKRGKYQVAEDVYFSHEEGSTIDIYYYPGTSLSGYGTPPSRSSRQSSFSSMTQLIGMFMLAVAGIMAFVFITRVLLPALFGGKTRTLPHTRSRPPTAAELEDRFGPIPRNPDKSPRDVSADAPNDWRDR
jgi:hypothetical protein